jgi:FkbM family methyltransferase
MIVDPNSLTEIMAYFEGRYDDAALELLCQLVRPGETVLDVGANIGFYAIPLAITAKTVGTNVIAFEPVPANYERLAANATLNGVSDHLSIRKFGLSASESTGRMTLREHRGRENGSGNAALFIAGDETLPSLEVSLRALDSIQVANVGLIKLDVEGHEHEFLEGAASTLQRDRPIIFIEVNREYYKRKLLDFDEVISAALPDNYRFFKLVISRNWLLGLPRLVGLKKAECLSEFAFENALFAPQEKVDRLLNLSFGKSWFKFDRSAIKREREGW